MRKITFDKRDYQLSERDYKHLQRRFDVSRARLNSTGYYCIQTRPICWNRKSKCLKCPLRSPQKKNISCTHLFTRIMGENLSKHLYMVDVGIFWNAQEDREARGAVEKISKFLEQAERISR